MPAPTRAEITRDVTLPTTQVEVQTSPGGAWVDVSASVASCRPVLEATGGEPSGVAMGPAVLPACDIEVMAESAAAFQTLRSYELARARVRARFGFGASDKLTRFAGLLMDGDGEAATRTRRWSCRGWDALIEGTEVRSPLFRRRAAATATTIISVEDPTLSTYQGGLINFILWMCGGRPLEQAASYPSAVFYYSCTEALIAPEFTWIAGDNPWEVMRRLCRGAGGQIYQDNDGVIRYLDPISLASGTPAFTFTDEVLTQDQRAAQGKAGYETLRDRYEAGARVTGVTVAYVTKLIGGETTVYENTVPFPLEPGASVTIPADTQLPLYTLVGAEVDAVVIRNSTKGVPGQVTVSAVLHSAQRVMVTITNTLADRVSIDAVRVRARAVGAGEEGSASYIVSGDRVVSVDDNPYVQSFRNAQMLARMEYDGSSNSGLIYELGGAAFDPDRYVGEVIGLTNAEYGLSNERCRIVRIDNEDGEWMGVALAPLGGLPTRDTVHRLGAISGTKAMAY